VNELMRRDLIDEFIISIIPIFVGSGTKLFHDGRPVLPLELVSATSFEKGLVQVHYRKPRPLPDPSRSPSARPRGSPPRR
jgi:dihydrofolate reductase